MMRKSKKTQQNFRTLSAALLAGTIILGTPAFAQDGNSELDSGFINADLIKNKPLETPTLDWLNNQGVNLKDYTSGYTLTPVSEKSESTITKYSVNKNDFSLTPHEYRYDIKNLSFGKGDNVKYYQPSNYNLEIEEVSSPNSDKRTYTFNYDGIKSDSLYDKIYQNANNKTLIKEESSSYEAWGQTYYYKSFSYRGPNTNNDGNTLTINNALFKNNTLSLSHNPGTNTQDTNYLYGGALYNAGTIENGLNADFLNNKITANITVDETRKSRSGLRICGGALYNSGIINGGITGNFIDNQINVTVTTFYSSHEMYGIAIYNEGTINGDIIGDFINNSSSLKLNSSNYGSEGSVIHAGTVNGSIIGNFVNNDASSVIYDGKVNGNISGNFINNRTAISNTNVKGTISGNFIGNSYGISGTDADIISGNFINNSTGIGYSSANTIIGTFIENGTAVSGVTAKTFIGDFIRNQNNIGSFHSADYVTGDFIENQGSLSGTIGTLAGNFVGNQSYSNLITPERIENLTSNFYKNTSSNSLVYVAAESVSNSQSASFIGKIKGDFIENSGEAVVATIPAGYSQYTQSATAPGTISEISANFIKNNVTKGVIYNEGKIDKVSGLFIDNTAPAIVTTTDLNIVADNELTEFTRNGSDNEYIAIVALGNNGVANNINLRTENNGKMLINDKIVANSVEKSIYSLRQTTSNSTLNDYELLKNGEDTGIKYQIERGWNYVEIYDEAGNKIMTVDHNNGDQMPAPDNFVMNLGYTESVKTHPKLNIDGDSSGVVVLNNNVEAKTEVEDLTPYVDITLSNTQLHLGLRDNVLDGNNLTLNSGLLNMVNGQASAASLNKLTLNGNTDFVADVDLKNKTMDRLTAQEYGEHTGNLNVIGMNLLSDAENNNTEILFADNGLKNHVTTNVDNIPDSQYQMELYTPIYKYSVKYENRDDAGYFVFNRGGQISNGGGGGSTVTPSNPSDAFNPAVLSSPVSTQAAGQSTMNETFRYVFEHADAFTQMPAMERFSAINDNKYAIASTDFNQNITYRPTDLHNKGAWVRPYTSFESINLSNGPKVNTINYGTLVGFDSDFRTLKKGWTNVSTAYLGYSGAQINYQGNDTTMNGGLVGLTETFYKGNFWTALTATAGAGVAETRTMYGKEDSTMLMAGLGSKTGYNFEFKEGKYILQPIMFMSYTFVNTFDYTNAAGVRINSDPMHTIQINPSLKFITNTKNGWQPYASVGMVWNLMNETRATANDIKLPEMHTKPYVEYGVGVQKRMKDKFTAFGQAMLRNGGRNGIALTAGFRWSLGNEGKPLEKVQEVNKTKIGHSEAQTVPVQQTVRKVVKQLTSQQKSALIKQNNTTRTTANAILKQL